MGALLENFLDDSKTRHLHDDFTNYHSHYARSAHNPRSSRYGENFSGDKKGSLDWGQ